MHLHLSKPYLDGPKAVHEKYNCLVSNGNRNECNLDRRSHHSGKAPLAKTSIS